MYKSSFSHQPTFSYDDRNQQRQSSSSTERLSWSFLMMGRNCMYGILFRLLRRHARLCVHDHSTFRRDLEVVKKNQLFLEYIEGTYSTSQIQIICGTACVTDMWVPPAPGPHVRGTNCMCITAEDPHSHTTHTHEYTP